MQSIASLMSIGRVSDIGNLDEIEEDEVNISATSQDTSAKISELASKFGLLDTDFDDMGESECCLVAIIISHMMCLNESKLFWLS